MDEQGQASAEMPRYRSHKEVWALEIASCTRDPVDKGGDPQAETPEPGCTLIFADAGYAPMHVERAVVSRYFPQAGDFLVVYSDGYKSISPRAAFIDGYTKI